MPGRGQARRANPRERNREWKTKVKLSLDGHRLHAWLSIDPKSSMRSTPNARPVQGRGQAAVEQSNEIRVIILEATGEKAFCVGADILAWTALSPLGMWSEWVRRGHRIFDRVERASNRSSARSKDSRTEVGSS